ncbi:hypothetical protein AZ66_14180 [Paenibacillus sp. E194]|nr:hypothetical protein AZ66_14180 [Paenibacillus sp. E194]
MQFNTLTDIRINPSVCLPVFLCEALTNTYTIREGKKSLYDINKFLYLEIWNKNNPSKRQNPIYRANIGGTIFFEVKHYQPYIVENFAYQRMSWVIHTIEQLVHEKNKDPLRGRGYRTPLEKIQLGESRNHVFKQS